ncbi:MAG: phosphopantetheine-binding protein [Candidatus Susulua stagnicola]|nr:phosphopantetheine-binding protein [Candidatus Susulua stagnicola]
MELEKEIIKLISETLDIEEAEVKSDQKLYDSIGVDSTEMVEIVVTLSKHFGLKIETNEITKFSTINEIVDLIERKKQF